MDTKWNSTVKKTVGMLVLGAVASACVIAAVIIVRGFVEWEYYPGVSVGFALGMAYLLVCFTRWRLRRADDRRGEEDTRARFRRLVREQRAALIGSVLWFLVVQQILMLPPFFYYEALLQFKMYWIALALCFEPVVCVGLPLYAGMGRRISALMMESLDQSRTREELMEDLKAQMQDAVEERVKSERMKIDLITNVSHDLKTPLTSVIGYIELMKKEEISGTMRDYLEVLTRKTDILKNMVENVFELAKASSGSVKLELETLDMNRLIRQVLADWDDRIREKGRQMKVELAEESAAVRADDGYLYRIVQNLVENALKYSLDGTRIFVRTLVADGRVSLTLINVSSYPIDFDAETVKARFARGDKARTTEGNGLGLAIVETYTHALGGSFDIQLEGDTFKAVVTFPLAESEEGTPHAETVPL